VHESIQRGGYGKIIFEHMIKRENIDPAKMAYDRPSEKLIGFLGKHYGLKNYVP
jgi:alpha-tubulin N-acetyltransferase 1